MASTEELLLEHGVAWFGFDEQSGNVFDKLGGNYTGTVTGATRVMGWNGEGNAMNFSGNLQFVRFNNNPIQSGEKTIRLKFKLLSAPADSRVIFSTSEGTTTYRGIGLQLTRDLTLNFFGHNGSTYNVSLQSYFKLSLNKWYDILINFNGQTTGSEVKMYINEELDNEVKLTADDAAYSNILALGRYPSSTGYINGEIDEFQIYSKALTPADFTQKHMAIKTTENKNLVLFTENGRVKEIPSINEVNLINQGYKWREIDDAIDRVGIDLTQKTTEYEMVSELNSPLGNGKIFTIPLKEFKTISIENND